MLGELDDDHTAQQGGSVVGAEHERQLLGTAQVCPLVASEGDAGSDDHVDEGVPHSDAPQRTELGHHTAAEIG